MPWRSATSPASPGPARRRSGLLGCGDRAAPARGAGRPRGRPSQCVNNLKRIGLANHNYHAAKKTFPGNIVDKEGKPLLSWRVAILPYLDQEVALQQVQARRALGQPEQQGAAQGDAQGFANVPSQ